MKPYIVSSPEFDITSGGIRVMWGLFGWLLAKGQVAYMNRYPDVDRIAIYPEITQGNPIGANTVVRYILNTPGLMGMNTSQGFISGPTEFAPTDHIYVFSKVFDTFNTDKNHMMFLPICNLHLFKDQKKLRNKSCYLVGKGKNLGVHPNDSIELTRSFAQDQQALADLLNECEVMYCYDKLSAMMEIARLCGCRVRYLGDYDKNQLSLYEPGLNGISFSKENTPLDVDLFREHYIELREAFSEKLDQFIEATQEG